MKPLDTLADVFVATMPSDLSAERILEEVGKKGLIGKRIDYDSWQLKSTPVPPLGNTRDGYLVVRDPFWANDLSRNYWGLLRLILHNFKFRRVLDKELYVKDYLALNDKLMKQWVMEHLSLPTAGLVDIQDLRWKKEIIAKARHGSRSKNNYILRTKHELEKFARNHVLSDYIYQDYHPLLGDYRVLVLGNKVLAVLRRRVRIQDGGKVGVKGVGRGDVPGTITQASVKLARYLGADFVGVDVGKKVDGSYFFIEYNWSPQFVAVERELELNIARKVVDYLVEDSLNFND